MGSYGTTKEHPKKLRERGRMDRVNSEGGGGTEDYQGGD